MTKLSVVNDEKPWYQEGLPFKCTGCGRCCGGSPGAVWLQQEDIERISSELNISKEAFLKEYTHRINGRLSLKEKPNYDCILLENKRCSVYQVRPKQCRTYPFWDGILESKETWEAEKHYCEGIHDAAPLIPSAEIKKIMN